MSTYQGLFYLVSGISSYILLFFILRNISLSQESSNIDEADKWVSKESLKIIDIISESHDVKTFIFKRKDKENFGLYKAGQFLSFQIGDDPKTLRSYSLSSSCEINSTLQVSIKKIKNGIGSEWFHNLDVGDNVLAFPPGGHFSDSNLSSDIKRIYVGGGIGITPLISMIKTNIHRGGKEQMVLFYGMASSKDLVFHNELVNLSETYSYFKYFPIVSAQEDEEWTGDTGYITYDYIISKSEINKEDNFYFCGPPVMTDSLIDSLISDGFDDDHLHFEKFASPSSVNLDEIDSIDASIMFNNEEYKYSGKKTILEFLEENDKNIPFACRSGVCGECKCKLLDGEVDSQTDAGLGNEEKSENYILTCVSRPKTDIKLDL